jgi:dipeptidyl-peptidase-4
MKIKIYLIATLLFSISSAYAQKELNLEDIWKNNAFGSRYVSGIQSLNDGLHYTTLVNAGKTQYIIKYQYKNGNAVDTIFNTAKADKSSGEIPLMTSYQFSPDEKKILLMTEQEQIYRHSFKSDYMVYEVATKKWHQLSSSGKQQLANFSPDGKHVAFVRNNNLFITDLSSRAETQITTDGEKNKIINGATDWVYEEEFSFDKAFEWNSNGNKLAFYRFDETEVKEFSMPIYGSLYPQNSTFKYPKAGEKNAVVEIFIYDLNVKSKTKVDIGAETDQYIPRIKWTASPEILSLQRMNRLQNKLELLLANASNGKTNCILIEKSDTYIEINNDLTFLNDGKSFIWSSELGGYNHLFHYGIDGKLIRQITTGNWEVISYKGYDIKNKVLYFTAAYSAPINKEVCRIGLNGSNFNVISAFKGYNEPSFSSTFDYFINAYSNANNPLQFTLYNNQGKQVRILEDNKTLNDKLKNYRLTQKEFMTVPTADGLNLNAWMMKPADFTESKKYPVIFLIYGGPGRNTVLNSWEGAAYMWSQYLTQKGYIVVSVDNKGTSYRGEKFKKMTYANLGMYETKDQIEAAKYFGTLPYVDPSRIGIQGWSFGGYLSSLCITKGNDVFKTAIAVAPVTNWRYYDSIYTERFLGLPQDNAKGYDDNSPINFVDQLKGNYLLIHGTADDNVHFQNSVEMATALHKANKQFDFMMYPDKNHGISGGNTRLHIYSLMTNFIVEKL